MLLTCVNEVKRCSLLQESRLIKFSEMMKFSEYLGSINEIDFGCKMTSGQKNIASCFDILFSQFKRTN